VFTFTSETIVTFNLKYIPAEKINSTGYCKADMVEFVNNKESQSESMFRSSKSQSEAMFGLFTNNQKFPSGVCKH
jgi:hypothetical protein